MNYENYKICPDLKENERCFFVQKYQAGEMVQLDHFHIAKSRMSVSAAANALQSLILSKLALPTDQHIAFFLNKRSKTPPADQLVSHVSHPEAGVIRHYLGQNTQGWFDEVVNPAQFRNTEVN